MGTQLEPRYDAIFLNLDRLNEPSALPTVVLLGSSKTRCAVEFDSDMSKRLAAMGSPARFIRITEGHASLRDFQQVFENLPRLRPAALLVESDLVTLEPNAYRLPEAPQYPGWRERSRHGLAVLISPNLVARRRPENRTRSWSECGYPADFRTIRKKREILKERRASTPAERAPFLRLAQRLKGLGIHVILLDLPNRTDEAGRKPWSFVQAEQRAMQKVMATHLVDRLGQAPELGSDNFQDEAHLNERGRAKASAWLASKLVPILRKSHAQ